MAGKRIDRNQPAIVEALRKCGCEFIHTSADPRSGMDGVIITRDGRVLPCEVKNGALKPSARRLTPNEQRTKAACEQRGAPYLILESVDDALRVAGGG